VFICRALILYLPTDLSIVLRFKMKTVGILVESRNSVAILPGFESQQACVVFSPVSIPVNWGLL
jgi:hypothetical protein